MGPEGVKEIHPLLDVEGNGIIGGIYSKSDGCVDPTGLTNSFAKGAKMAGATVLEDCPVERIVR